LGLPENLVAEIANPAMTSITLVRTEADLTHKRRLAEHRGRLEANEASDMSAVHHGYSRTCANLARSA
jgi:hypothetical protein